VRTRFLVAMAATSVLAQVVAYRWWQRRWGASPAEAAAPMPGDDLLPSAAFTATRAISVAAPPEQVWTWLEAPAGGGDATVVRERPPRERVWAAPGSTWSWLLSPVGPGPGTRLVTRRRSRYRSATRPVATLLHVELVDFPVTRRTLLEVRAHAEAEPPAEARATHRRESIRRYIVDSLEVAWRGSQERGDRR
jgi:hypothetical protein